MKNNLVKNRAMNIIALFILLINFIFPQIDQIEHKCIWISRDDLMSKESIESALLFANEVGFDKVFLQVRGRGDAFYNSEIVVKNNMLDTNFDPLQYAMEVSDTLDIQIHAWVNCYILWSGKSFPNNELHILNTNPLWTETDIYGKSDSRINLESPKSPSWEGIYLSPLNPEVNQYLREVIREIYQKYNIDGIHLDYIRYQDEYYGFHRDGRKEFDILFNVDPLDISRGIISTRYGWEQSYVDSIKNDWDIFKQNKITELLEFINEDIDLLDRDISISAAVKPNLVEAKVRWHQNWQDWLERDLVDFVVPMNYSSDLITFMTNIKIMKNSINDIYINKIIMGVAAYNQDAESVVDKMFLTRLNGFNGISIFSYGVHKDNLDWFNPVLESLNNKY
tara:strand:- start:19328 stop:20509 length:1182 start_codon:yes stop_codon:yes gene_type:complete